MRMYDKNEGGKKRFKSLIPSSYNECEGHSHNYLIYIPGFVLGRCCTARIRILLNVSERKKPDVNSWPLEEYHYFNMLNASILPRRKWISTRSFEFEPKYKPPGNCANGASTRLNESCVITHPLQRHRLWVWKYKQPFRSCSIRHCCSIIWWIRLKRKREWKSVCVCSLFQLQCVVVPIKTISLRDVLMMSE